MILRPRSLGWAASAAVLMALAACSDATSPEPGQNGPAQLQVDASTGWAFVRLGETAQPVQVSEPAASQSWDIAFNATSVMLNGGTAGPAGVTAWCLCQNGTVAPTQVAALTAATELPDFEAVTAAAAPTTASSWRADSLAEAVTGWWSYDMTTHVVTAAAGKSWKVRLAARGADTAYAKLRVTKIENPQRAHAGKVTFEYAVQPRRGAPLGAVKTATVDLTNGGVSYDLVGGTPAAGSWDIRFEGYTIRLNGGSSGAGNAGAAAATTDFAAITDASDLVSQQYVRDATGGVFTLTPWYLYNVTGSDHQIWPTFQVYLVKRGSELYKVQITGYYDTAGNPRRITFRYAKLAS